MDLTSLVLFVCNWQRFIDWDILVDKIAMEQMTKVWIFLSFYEIFERKHVWRFLDENLAKKIENVEKMVF